MKFLRASTILKASFARPSVAKADSRGWRETAPEDRRLRQAARYRVPAANQMPVTLLPYPP
jgi:hypothetical protein